jgi:pimeloyl-ACP methyl ester carboxylesterase
MPAVFVHGNPETAAIWRPMLDRLDNVDTICLSPPGFGAPVPEDWAATRNEYLDWLTAELEGIGEPVDLVGHDWGGGHVMGVALTRSDLLRSWCVDVAGIFHPDYVWHDMAQAWQTPDVGEQTIEAMINLPLADRVASYEDLGMPTDVATELAEATDETMGRCILGLYRDAAQPKLAELGQDLSAATARPGLVVIAELDTYVGTAAMARATAERAGATVAVLEGVGHWWMLQDPAAGAAALTDFWQGI